ncbi:MAG: RDD family protein [Microthrixaceae bacterium]
MRFDDVTAYAWLYGPLLGLVSAGALALGRDRQRPWATIAGLVAVSTLAWLLFVGLYQHETPCSTGNSGCPTVFGYDAPVGDENPIGPVLVLSVFVAPAAWSGWRRRAPALTIGAALTVGPTLLALWTAPRGDNDGLWVLVLWFLPVLGGLAAIVAALARRVGAARGTGDRNAAAEATLASLGDRLAALAIDLFVAGAVLVVPLTMLSHRKLEIVAAVIGLTAATLYLALPVAWRGHSLGQRLVGISVLDATTRVPPSLPRAMLRSAIVVLEVIAVPTLIFSLPAVVELLAVTGSERTLTDRLVGTAVVSRRPSDTTAP